MRQSGLFFFVLGASLVMLSSAFSEDYSDLFLKAYKAFQNGEKLEREAKPQEALKESSRKSANRRPTGNRLSSNTA